VTRSVLGQTEFEVLVTRVEAIEDLVAGQRPRSGQQRSSLRGCQLIQRKAIHNATRPAAQYSSQRGSPAENIG
jgi:hypothetical protein